MSKAKFILSKDNLADYKKNYEVIANDDNIQQIVYDYLNKYGPSVNLNCIDVSYVTQMNDLFANSGFEGNVSEWDVSSVENFDGMFGGCRKFNCDISAWEVRSAKSMDNMFANCRIFNISLNNWDVSSVTNMAGMFRGCHRFNKNLDKWDVSNVTDMSCMFINCLEFEGKGLKQWKVNKVEDITAMFKYCGKFKEDLSKWSLDSCKTILDFDVDTKSWSNEKKPLIKIIK